MRHLRFVMSSPGALRAVLWSTVSTRATPEQAADLLRGVSNASDETEARRAGAAFASAVVPDWRVESVGGRATAESFRFRSVVLLTPEGVEYEVEVNTDPSFGSPLCAVSVDINQNSTYLAASILWEVANGTGLYMPREYHSWYEETTGGSVKGPHPDPSVIWRNRDEKEEEAAASSS